MYTSNLTDFPLISKFGFLALTALTSFFTTKRLIRLTQNDIEHICADANARNSLKSVKLDHGRRLTHIQKKKQVYGQLS